MTKEQLLESAKSLPKEDRIDLAIELWGTIELEDGDLPLTEAQRQELDRRVAADKADPQPAEDWDQLRGKLLRGEF